jgi:hypothetical protein
MGNSEFSATSAVFKALGEKRNFWEVEDRYYAPTTNNWSAYEFSIYRASNHFKIYSFPNTCKFHIWNAQIEENDVFQKLRMAIEGENVLSAF